ncbi:hypothetical protein VOLCADRAFT_90822 [Volvox carteri f. nagariensis]|uniref:N-acetyltransferase domain-containing protein n=1 Tax=Volvox carteri f. nagariensis TaxID=3068 RepID=D8TV53_VOLCA|nr:uncharacterized protein VOLCADRAFT_90822 [Volvox carteri f. nagariensis]EFJ48517.1 hypothetical protein VOLCADRAFT_90822 [Volvox carteri f. nagariensis]|eukprot:XP_002950316.1 hypothetical protein VOLCADRAFT_90822 [Volvox carteri f. nagariensis]
MDRDSHAGLVAIVEPSVSTDVRILFQATAEGHRRMGLGRLLTRIIQEAAVAANHQYVAVSVVDKAVMEYWHQRLGFQGEPYFKKAGRGAEACFKAIEAECQRNLAARVLVHPAVNEDAAKTMVLQAVQTLHYGRLVMAVRSEDENGAASTAALPKEVGEPEMAVVQVPQPPVEALLRASEMSPPPPPLAAEVSPPPPQPAAEVSPPPPPPAAEVSPKPPPPAAEVSPPPPPPAAEVSPPPPPPAAEVSPKPPPPPAAVVSPSPPLAAEVSPPPPPPAAEVSPQPPPPAAEVSPPPPPPAAEVSPPPPPPAAEVSPPPPPPAAVVSPSPPPPAAAVSPPPPPPAAEFWLWCDHNMMVNVMQRIGFPGPYGPLGDSRSTSSPSSSSSFWVRSGTRLPGPGNHHYYHYHHNHHHHSAGLLLVLLLLPVVPATTATAAVLLIETNAAPPWPGSTCRVSELGLGSKAAGSCFDSEVVAASMLAGGCCLGSSGGV